MVYWSMLSRNYARYFPSLSSAILRGVNRSTACENNKPRFLGGNDFGAVRLALLNRIDAVANLFLDLARLLSRNGEADLRIGPKANLAPLRPDHGAQQPGTTTCFRYLQQKTGNATDGMNSGP